MNVKRILATGIVGIVLVGGSVVFAGPASAGREMATLTVVKTVDGTAPADAEFVINVFCEDELPNGTVPIDEVIRIQGDGVVYDEDITFGPTGGDEDFDFFGPARCTITEIDDGGADSSTGPVDVFLEDPTSYEAEIVNTFDPEPTTTTTVPSAPTTAAPAAGSRRRGTGVHRLTPAHSRAVRSTSTGGRPGDPDSSPPRCREPSRDRRPLGALPEQCEGDAAVSIVAGSTGSARMGVQSVRRLRPSRSTGIHASRERVHA